MREIEIALGDHSYRIHIGHDLDYGGLLHHEARGRRELLIVTNETVGALYLERAERLLATAGFRVSSVCLRDGESYKNIDSYMEIMQALLTRNYGRDCMLVALGGGVVGDVTGFAAATYQRGVAYAQLPTTLLAMVDSAVGGKTAINHPLGKNMIGAFYQPQCVLADLEVLRSLPLAELTAGLGEVIKYGLIMDQDFFAFLQRSIERVYDYDLETLEQIVRRCCQLKAEVVARDEKEHSLRAILNFGHTFGHALETHEGYGVYLHGQAVGLGMAIASALSMQRGTLTAAEHAAIIEVLIRARLPQSIPETMSAADFLSCMRHDKKVRSGIIRYVLLNHIGQAFVADDVSDQEVLQLINKLKSNP